MVPPFFSMAMLPTLETTNLPFVSEPFSTSFCASPLLMEFERIMLKLWVVFAS